MIKQLLLLCVLPCALFAQEPKKDNEWDQWIAQATTTYERVKPPGYFIPEISVSFRFEGNTLFSSQGAQTIGGATTLFDIKFSRYAWFGAVRFLISTPFAPGGTHPDAGVRYYINRAYRFGVAVGGGLTVFDKRLKTGRGSAVNIALFGIGELLADGDTSYKGGGLEFNLRYFYNFHRYFALTAGFDVGWRISDPNKFKTTSLIYGIVLGMAF